MLMYYTPVKLQGSKTNNLRNQTGLGTTPLLNYRGLKHMPFLFFQAEGTTPLLNYRGLKLAVRIDFRIVITTPLWNYRGLKPDTELY